MEKLGYELNPSSKRSVRGGSIQSLSYWVKSSWRNEKITLGNQIKTRIISLRPAMKGK